MALKILIAPMDWGLGHTTRCIPLAQYYHKEGHQIFFAGNEAQINLFTKNCPFVTPLHLDGYNITYPSKGWHFLFKMAAQLPKIKATIQREQLWITQQMSSYQFDVILSDNRYGLHHPDAMSIILTHQLQIETGSRLGNFIIKEQNKKLLSPFNYCWIVDDEAKPLAGKLSAPIGIAAPQRYIGWLSQFQYLASNKAIHPLEGKPYVLAILSGPEPMRTQLEDLLLLQMATIPQQQYVLIAGSSVSPKTTIPSNVHYLAVADAKTTFSFLEHCDSVISRSGYTTVMDLMLVPKPVVFIPTPGQWEQLVIAQSLKEHQQIPYYHQDAFLLSNMKPQKPHWEFVSYFPQLSR